MSGAMPSGDGGSTAARQFSTASICGRVVADPLWPPSATRSVTPAAPMTYRIAAAAACFW